MGEDLIFDCVKKHLTFDGRTFNIWMCKYYVKEDLIFDERRFIYECVNIWWEKI